MGRRFFFGGGGGGGFFFFFFLYPWRGKRVTKGKQTRNSRSDDQPLAFLGVLGRVQVKSGLDEVGPGSGSSDGWIRKDHLPRAQVIIQMEESEEER